MKYTVMSASQYEVVGKTESAIEALQMKYTYEIRNTTDEVIIRDENRIEFDPDAELEIFVDSIICGHPADCTKIDLEEAELLLGEWDHDGVEIPEQMTAEILVFLWNKALDDAEGMDLEPDLPAVDTHAKALQALADVAKSEADRKWHAFEDMRQDPLRDTLKLAGAYHRYLEAKAFYEGVAAAIMAAGYAVITEVDTHKLTVTKM